MENDKVFPSVSLHTFFLKKNNWELCGWGGGAITDTHEAGRDGRKCAVGGSRSTLGDPVCPRAERREHNTKEEWNGKYAPARSRHKGRLTVAVHFIDVRPNGDQRLDDKVVSILRRLVQGRVGVVLRE